MADHDSQNRTMSNQNFWQKKFGELPLIRQSFFPYDISNTMISVV